MATEKQIAANRRNAQKSTGPRTPEGKARVAQNGRRVSLLADAYLLPEEGTAAFQKFVASYHRDFQPASPFERDLVNTMAVSRWRILRSAKLEAAYLSLEMGTFSSDPAAQQLAGVATRRIGQLNRQEARLEQHFDSAFDRLRAHRALQANPGEFHEKMQGKPNSATAKIQAVTK